MVQYGLSLDGLQDSCHIIDDEFTVKYFLERTLNLVQLNIKIQSFCYTFKFGLDKSSVLQPL
jgi:hypothetical protein